MRILGEGRVVRGKGRRERVDKKKRSIKRK